MEGLDRILNTVVLSLGDNKLTVGGIVLASLLIVLASSWHDGWKRSSLPGSLSGRSKLKWFISFGESSISSL